MLRNKRKELIAALILIAPFLLIYSVVFIYPTIKMFILSFTDAPLVGSGDWVGWENYERLLRDRWFKKPSGTPRILSCSPSYPEQLQH